jgi:hypothetical protein
MGQAFRRLVLSSIEPAFQEVANFAAAQGAECRVELALNGVQPRAMFYVRPSGRSIRYEMDADGNAVREIEGVYYRALGQRMVWDSVDTLTAKLTSGYARTAAAALVQEHFRALSA